DLPVGVFEVQLVGRAAGGAWRTLPDILATVTVRAGAVSELHQSVESHLLPAELRGSAFVDGEPARTVALLHGTANDDGGIRVVDVTLIPTSDRGVYRMSVLLAGHYAVELRLTCSGEQIAVPVCGWQKLGGGAVIDCGAFAVRTAPLQVQLRDVGQAARAVTQGVLVVRDAAGAVIVGVPDGRCMVAFDHLPVSDYGLQFRRHGQLQQLGRIDVA